MDREIVYLFCLARRFSEIFYANHFLLEIGIFLSDTDLGKISLIFSEDHTYTVFRSCRNYRSMIPPTLLVFICETELLEENADVGRQRL